MSTKTLAMRISWTIILFSVSILAFLFISFLGSWKKAQVEVLQAQGWHLASDIARALQPSLDPVYMADEVRRSALWFIDYNPMIDIYLLDHSGSVVEAFCMENCFVAERQVELSPIQTFLGASKPDLPLLGTNPAEAERPTVFSVAPVVLRGKPHFVYAILANRRSQRIQEVFVVSTGLRNSALFALAVATIAPLTALLFVRATAKRFDGIMQAVRSFQQSNYQSRAPESGSDELAELGRAVNKMAEAISENVASLHEKDVRRRELITSIWHDLRSPISAIGTLSETIQRHQPASPGDLQRLLSSIIGNITLLTKFLEELRELGKLETGETTPDLGKCSINLIVDNVYTALHLVAERKGVELRHSVPDSLPFVLADSVMISRVLTNLIENALRYTPAGGLVEIWAAAEEQNVCVQVRDTGSGIHPVDLEHIFDRAYQSRARPGEEHGAAGLGLAIVKRMVECQSGEIRVASTSSAGTTFAFTIPRFKKQDN